MLRKIQNTFLLFLLVVLALPILAVVNPTSVEANQNITFHGGYYINLAGGGANLDGNINNYNDQADCSPSLGFCTAKNRTNGQNYSNGNVQKYICRGKVLNCDLTNSPSQVIKGPDYSYTHYIYDLNYPPILCDQTIQLDVFDGNHSLKGFMTWYSGACAAPAPTLVTVCTGEILTWNQLIADLKGANYPGPWDINSAVAAYNRAACPAPKNTPVKTPPATPIPTPKATANPTATPVITPTPKPTVTPKPSTSPTVTPVVTPIPTTAPSNPPKVVSQTNTNTQSLPVTGAPLFAWAFAGLAPLGLKLRKTGKDKQVDEINANSLWQQRELYKN